MSVVRPSELADACRILQAIGHPSPTEDVRHVATINRHIKAFIDQGTPVPAELGSLKPIKVRMCIDASVLLNKHIKKWRFPYVTVHDAIALLQPRWWMAKIDLKRFYWQLLLHTEDWPMLGIKLPTSIATWSRHIRSTDLGSLTHE